MRAHGWGGLPPDSPDQARARILQVARAGLVDQGSTSMSEVAGRLGVTRQTVYRYYPTTEDLLNAAALDAIAQLVDDLVDHVQAHLARVPVGAGVAAEAAIEVVAYFYEHLRDDPALNRLIGPGRISSTLAGMTSPSSVEWGGQLLRGLGIDWAEVGFPEGRQVELVEHLLRTLQSFILDPGEPPRSGAALRAYLHRWLAPALRP